MTQIRIARRRLLQSTLALGGLAAFGGLAGCSNEGRGDTGSQAENASVLLPTYIPYTGLTADLPGENGVSDAMLSYPADPQALTDGPPGDGQDISAFALTNTPVPPSMDKNSFWQALNERLGFTYDVSLVPSGDYTEKFQTTVAGDRLPDLFTFWPKGIPGLPSLLHERAADLTDLLSGDAIEKYPFLANIPTESWKSSVYGGRIYGVPISRGAQSSTVLYGRYDLLEEQGIDPAAQSWDDLQSMFVELTSSSSWALANVPMAIIRQSLGIANGWSTDGGTWVSANEDERQLEALEIGRKLYADGLVHPDTATSDNQKRQGWTIAGTTRFLEDTFSAWPAFANLSGDQVVDLDVILPPKIDGGGTADIHLAGPTHNLTGISLKSADRAEALLSFLDYLAAPFGSAEHLFKNYGLDGVHHDVVDGEPVLNDKGKSETQLSLKYLGEGPWVTYMPGRPDIAQSLYDVQNEAVPTAIPNPSATLFSETESRKGTQIGSTLGDLQSDIIYGRKPVSAWNDAVASWKKNGGDAMRDEFQEAAAANAQG